MRHFVPKWGFKFGAIGVIVDTSRMIRNVIIKITRDLAMDSYVSCQFKYIFLLVKIMQNIDIVMSSKVSNPFKSGVTLAEAPCF